MMAKSIFYSLVIVGLTYVNVAICLECASSFDGKIRGLEIHRAESTVTCKPGITYCATVNITYNSQWFSMNFTARGCSEDKLDETVSANRNTKDSSTDIPKCEKAGLITGQPNSVEALFCCAENRCNRLECQLGGGGGGGGGAGGGGGSLDCHDVGGKASVNAFLMMCLMFLIAVFVE